MLSIQTNIASLYGQQNLSVNSNFQQTTINRLTSGYRINSAADDPAGMAVPMRFATNAQSCHRAYGTATMASASCRSSTAASRISRRFWIV